MAVEPLPEVRLAAEQLAVLTHVDVTEALDVLGQLVLAMIPSCVGVSLTLVVDGEPYTVTATSSEAALLDAAQYLDGGPCIDSAHSGAHVVVDDVLDEDRWQLWGHAARGSGVRASLSLPLGVDGERPGALNLYASDPHAFSGRHELLAEVFHVPADRIVANGDLSFMTRDLARRLPERLAEKSTVDRAVGILAAVRGWEPAAARTRLDAAAARAGTTSAKVADLVLSLHAE